MTRVVTVLEVAEPSVWEELGAHVPLAEHTEAVLDERRRIMKRSFEALAEALQDRLLVRYARRDAAATTASRQHLVEEVAGLRHDVRRVLISAQRHAWDDVVIGRQAWDPLHDASAVRALHGVGLIEALPDDAPVYEGRYRLNADLAPPPPVPYAFADAVMSETDDLPVAGRGPVQLLHDMASLAAALEHLSVKRTHAGGMVLADARRLGKRLACADIAADGRIEVHDRWGRALRGLEALHAISMDPFSRELHLDLGLEDTLAGETEEATDRLVHRLVDRDLHVVVPAVRAALRQAGDGAVDELVFFELLRDQHRDVLFPMWQRDGRKVYPTMGGELPRAWDDEGFDAVELPMVRAALVRMARFGLLRRAPGVFAATPDGRRWAMAKAQAHPPVWVSGDLEIIVPPDALTPWERFQVERLGHCLQRDVVDRFRLERRSLRTWLSTHEVSEALDLLRRRCPALPAVVVQTLEDWGRQACRAVLVRGVILDDAAPA